MLTNPAPRKSPAPQEATGRRRAVRSQALATGAAVRSQAVWAIKRALLPALTTALLLALVPTPAPAFTKAVFGPVFRNGADQFPLYRRLHAGIYESYVYWYQIAPAPPRDPTDPRDPAYHWPGELIRAVAEARANHMRVMLELSGSPAWSNGGHEWNWMPRPSDYAAFATATARRFPSVHLWMVWGEPNRTGDFMPEVAAPPGRPLDAAQKVAPHNYARLLAVAYHALKAVSPANQVIGGSTFTGGSIDTKQWIENMRLPDGRPPPLDMYAHNPFSYTDPSFRARPSGGGQVQFKDLRRLARWVDRYLRRGIPLFLSEWTIPTAPDQQFPYWVRPAVAATWIRDALRLCRHWRRIYALGWVVLSDDPPLSYGGLLEADGTPKPGFAAFADG